MHRISAIICRRHGGYYHVLTSDLREVPCRVKGVLKKKGTHNLAVVGDRVEVEIPDNGDALISQILPRTSSLVRAKGFSDKGKGKARREGQILISNLDQVLIMNPCREPDFHPALLERFLILVESMDLKPVILLNKIDLLGQPDELDSYIELYQSMGYTVIPMSIHQGIGIRELNETAQGKVSFLMGPSGSGKSTLMNHLRPDLHLATGIWSERCKTGPQTTTHTCLYPVSGDTFVADTAGFSQIFLFHLPMWQLRWCMPDFREAPNCRYHNCLHREDEDGCALPQAVAEGLVNADRLERYRKFLLECNPDRLLDE